MANNMLVLISVLCFLGLVDAQCGCLRLSKVLDLNGDGDLDSGEPEIQDWGFKVKNLATGKTFYYNASTTLQLAYGTYEVCDRLPSRPNWYLTSEALCMTYTVNSAECIEARSLCMCTGPSNVPPSLSVFNAITPSDLNALRDPALGLVRADGLPFAPSTIADVKAWYNAATPSGAARYYLSAQLGLATLNKLHALSGSDPLVKAPFARGWIAGNLAISGPSPKAPFVGYSSVILAAAKLNTNATFADSARLEIAKELKSLNTNEGYGQSSACPFVLQSVSTAGTFDFNGQCEPCRRGCLRIGKVYDYNGDGINNGERFIVGWTFRVKNVATGQYYYYNSTAVNPEMYWSFGTHPEETLLPFGTYEVCDMPPTRYNWYLSGNPLCRTYTLTSETCVDAISLCFCTGRGYGKTPRYWLGEETGEETVTPDDFSYLSNNLDLVDGSRAPFNPTSTVELKNWFNGASPSSDPAYYLSAHVAIAVLNLRHHFTDGLWHMVKAKESGQPGPYGDGQFMSLGFLVNDGVFALRYPTENATMLAFAKDLRDVNHNEGFFQRDACGFEMQPLNFAPMAVVDMSKQCVTCDQGCLALEKTYDLNVNGQTDAGEPSVPGAKLAVTSYATGNTVVYATPKTLYLPYGKYRVCDLVPTQPNWSLTTQPLCRNYTLSDNTCMIATAPCLCTGPSTFKQVPFWTEGERDARVYPDDIAELQGRNLRNADLSPFVPADGAQLAAWLASATTANTPQWLSAQLAASILNMRRTSVGGNQLLKAIHVAPLLGITNHYFASLSSVQDFAVNLLSTPTNNLNQQITVANFLRDANANQNFVQSNPCPVNYGVLPASGSSAGLQPTCLPGQSQLLDDDFDNQSPIDQTLATKGTVVYATVGVAVGVAALVVGVVAAYVRRQIVRHRSIETPADSPAGLDI